MNASIKLSAMYHRLITIALLGIAVAIIEVNCIDPPEYIPPAASETTSNFSTAPQINVPVGPPKLLESYLAPVMQALAYHIELLQYEPLSTTTIEPPFEGSATLSTSSTTVSPFGQWPTTQKPSSASTPWWQPSTSSTPGSIVSTTSTSWWQQPTSSTPSLLASTTSTPWWQKPSSSSPSTTPWWQTPSTLTTTTATSSTTSATTTTTQKPTSVTWWAPSTTSTAAPFTASPSSPTLSSMPWWQTTKTTSPTPPTISTSVPWWQTSTQPTTKPPTYLSTQWWQTSSISPTQAPSTAWWQTSSKPSPTTTTQATSPPWWQTSTQRPISVTTTTTQKPWWQTSSTGKPVTSSPWWQSTTNRPPSSWIQQLSSTLKPSSTQSPISVTTTTTHKPWWQTSSTGKPVTSSPWWQSTTNRPPSSWIQQLSSTLKPSSAPWWETPTKPTTVTQWWQSTPKPTTTRPTQSTSWWTTTQKPATYKPPISWFSSTSTTKKPWWETNTTTRKPAASSIWWIPFSTVTTTTQRPWWQDSTQSKPSAISWTTTAKPPSQWWTTAKPPITWWSATKPSTTWWAANKPTTSSWYNGKPSSSWWTATKPSTQWWQQTTTKSPTNYWWQSTTKNWWDVTKTTTQKPWWVTTTSQKLPTFISWQSPIWSLSNGKPPSKPALHTTDDAGVQETTPFHLPGNIAPSSHPNHVDTDDAFLGQENNIDYEPQANEVHPVSAIAPAAASSTVNNAPSTTRKNQEWPFEMPSLAGDANFIEWLLQGKSKDTPNDFGYDFSRLDPLPGSLLRDILTEKSELPALRDIDNVNEFLRIYDDSYGRSRPTSGKKRVPPTKPYVEFLMLYDLLKREAKALNLTIYEGYSEQMVENLAATSKRSSEIQLHILMTRMLEQGDVKRSDVTTRVKLIIKDLENPNSVTAKSLHLIPPLQFVP